MLGIAMSDSFADYVRELRRRWPSRDMDQHDRRPAAAESDGEQTQPRTETAIFDDEDTQIMSDNPETEAEWLSEAQLNERYR